MTLWVTVVLAEVWELLLWHFAIQAMVRGVAGAPGPLLAMQEFGASEAGGPDVE